MALATDFFLGLIEFPKQVIQRMGTHEGYEEQADSSKVYSHEEEIEHWRSKYLGVKEFLKGLDAPKPPPQEAPQGTPLSGRERRTEPRYSFDDGAKIFVHIGPKAFKIINISIGGVAFYSDVQFKPGTKLLLSALGMIALDVEILECEMEEVDSRMMEYRYCVRARFGPRVNGYQVYVLAREMYLQEGNSTAISLEAPPTRDPGTRQ